MKTLPPSFHRAVQASVISAFFFTGNEYLFAFTKNPLFSEINNQAWVTPPLFLFLTSWLFFSGVGFLLCVALFLLIAPIARITGRQNVATVLFTVPAFFAAATALAVCDHFTFPLYGFSSITHDDSLSTLLRILYGTGFLVTWLLFGFSFVRSAGRRTTPPSPAASVVLGVSVCTFIVVTGVLSARYEESLPMASVERIREEPNVVILSLESAAADLSSAYEPLSYDSTPFLRRLASESVRAENYFSNGYNSRESLNTIISGLHPFQHEGFYPTHIIPETVAEMNLPNALRRNGFPYEILRVPGAVLSEYDANFLLDPVPPLFREFREEEFAVESISALLLQRFDRIVFNTGWPDPFPGLEGVQKTIDRAHANGRPFFIHIHAIPSHGPYNDCSQEDVDAVAASMPPGTLPEELCYLVKLRRTDDYARSFDDLLHSTGDADNTVFVVVADHPIPVPYSLQSSQRVRDMMRIPLFIRLPHEARKGEVITSNAQSIDITPTILDALGLPPVPWSNGVSLLRPDFDAAFKTRPVFIDQGYKSAYDILVCDRLRSKPIGNRDEVRMEDFVPTAAVTTHCDDSELPPLASIIDQVHSVQWKEPKYP